MRQLSGQDASFLYTETVNAPMHTASIAIYDPSTAPGGFVTFKSILEYLTGRLHLAPILRQRLVRVPMDLDHPYWVEDPNFDIEFHVRHIALPKPGDWRQLCIQSARLQARSLDENRPLWELYVVEGLDNVTGVPRGSYAYVTKIHHAAVDGVSGTEMFTALHDLIPDAVTPPPTVAWQPETIPQPWELLGRAGMNQAMRPFQFAQMMTRALPDVRSASPTALGTIANQIVPPRTRFNVTMSPNRVMDGFAVPLADVKKIRASLDRSTVNDVVLAIVAGGLRRYLNEKSELPTESLVTMIPVSVRDPGDKTTDGNSVSAMICPLHTNVADPTERFAAIRDATVQAKAVLHAVGARHLTELAAFMPGALMGLAARLGGELAIANQTTPRYNTVVTNVPGPQVAMYSAGARLVATYGMGPVHDGMGLMNIATSYCGQLMISFSACRDVVPDPAWYAECLQASYNELLTLAADEDHPSAPKRSSRQTPTKATPKTAVSKTAVPKKASAAKVTPKAGATKTAKSRTTTPRKPAT